jgi:hypothetical protein
MNHDDWQMHFASVEQRSWIAVIEAFLKGECDAPLPLDLFQSRLSMWMNTETEVSQFLSP